MDWSGLDHDILRLIAKKLKDISDFVRLRAVCMRWRSIVDLSDMAIQSPCNVNYICDSDSSNIVLHQIFSKKVHIVPINNISLEGEVTFMFGTLSGILLFYMSKNSKPWLLLNPLNGFHTFLPFEKACQVGYPIYFGPSCRPKTNQVKNYIDVVFRVSEDLGIQIPRVYKICLWGYDDMEWTGIAEVPLSVEEHATYCNNRRLCVVSQETGHTRVIDMYTGKITVIRDRGPCMELMYLVEEGGDMLCVFRDVRRFQFEVYMLENFDTNPRLRKLKSIGSRVIFINNIHSALCLKASDCEGYQSNCIYVKSYYKYDIENNRTEQTGSWADFTNKWFVPSLF